MFVIKHTSKFTKLTNSSTQTLEKNVIEYAGDKIGEKAIYFFSDPELSCIEFEKFLESCDISLKSKLQHKLGKENHFGWIFHVMCFCKWFIRTNRIEQSQRWARYNVWELLLLVCRTFVYVSSNDDDNRKPGYYSNYDCNVLSVGAAAQYYWK